MAESGPKYSSAEVRKFSRRSLLLGSLGGIIAGGLIEGAVIGRVSISTETQEKQKDKDLLDKQINEGLSARWKDAVAYAGFMVVSPQTPFFRDPTLRHRLASPVRPEQRIGILRPLFVKGSLAYNGDKISAPLHTVETSQVLKPDALAFLPPDTSDARFYYFRYNPDTMEAYKRAYLSDEGPQSLDIFGEHITIAARYKSGNQRIPYLEIDDYDDSTLSRPVVRKSFRACAASLAFDSSEAANGTAQYFVTTPTYEPISAPVSHA